MPAGTDEIAEAVLFLSCAESNMIAGVSLVVDGGFTIYQERMVRGAVRQDARVVWRGRP